MSAPSTAMEAGMAAMGVALLALFAGFLLTLAIARLCRARADWILCLGLAPVAFVGFALVVMLGHIATDGAIFGNATLVFGITAGVLTAASIATIVRRGGEPTSKAGLLLLLVAVAVGLIAWCTPVFLQFPQWVGGDIPWHLAFAEQLINGRPLPTSWMAGTFPNDYPWLFHAVLAFFARFSPGG
ncbi:MAG TPA: hypothetical protein VE712_03670, partial [Actinomycetota bacterium]|nr:hypothetical protein [Actinomycetota bacterium]